MDAEPGMVHPADGAIDIEHDIAPSAQSAHEHADPNAGLTVTASNSVVIASMAAKRFKSPPCLVFFEPTSNKRRATCARRSKCERARVPDGQAACRVARPRVGQRRSSWSWR
jgi:hypothetical protein